MKFNAFTVLSEPVDVNLALDLMARALQRFHQNQWSADVRVKFCVLSSERIGSLGFFVWWNFSFLEIEGVWQWHRRFVRWVTRFC